MKSPAIVAAIGIVIAIALAVFALNRNSQKAPQVTSQVQSSPETQAMMVGVAIANEQNQSGQSGQVYWQEKNGKVTVTINLEGALQAPQPAHLHTGTCNQLGAIKYPLNDVVNGKSETTLDVTEAQLKADLPLAANVHKSQTELSVYVACANITTNPKMVTEDEAMKMMELGNKMLESDVPEEDAMMEGDSMENSSPQATPAQ
jgi:hypothetical protein